MVRDKRGRYAGYRYLRITVEDVDTGPIDKQNRIYTFCKPENVRALFDKILRIARWPDELMAAETLGEFRSLSDNPDDVIGPVIIKDKSFLKVANRQLAGGRAKQGLLSPSKASEYQCIAEWFYKSGLSKPEFSREKGISPAKVGRALAYVAKKKVSKNRP